MVILCLLLLAGAVARAQSTPNTPTTPLLLQGPSGALVVDSAANEIYTAGTTLLTHPANQQYVTVVQGYQTPGTLGSDGSILVPYAANQMAVNPVTGTLYMINTAENVVMVVTNGSNGNCCCCSGPSGASLISVATQPVAIAVDSVENMVYVLSKGGNAYGSGGTLTVINGATNTVAGTINAGADNISASMALDPQAHILYIAQSYSILEGPDTAGGDVWAYNAATASTPVSLSSELQLGVENNNPDLVTNSIPDAIAVNPVTHVVYVADAEGYVYEINANLFQGKNPTNYNYVMIPDTYQGVVQGVPTALSANPVAIAVNPVTNEVFVANLNASVLEIDGTGIDQPMTIMVPQPSSTNTATVSSIVVDSGSDKVYVSGSYSYYVTLIDPVNNFAATSIPVTPLPGQTVNQASSGGQIALNPVTHKIYVSTNEGLMTINEPSDYQSATVTDPNAQAPGAIALDPTLSQAYVANLDDATVSIFSTLGYVSNVDVSNQDTLLNPVAISANPVDHHVYVADAGDPDTGMGGGLVEFDATNAGNGNEIAATSIPIGDANPFGVAVNPLTDTVYVANVSGDNVLAVNVAKGNQVTTIPAGTRPKTVVAASNQIFVVDAGDANTGAGGGLTIIDGATNAATTVSDPAANMPWDVVVSGFSNFAYVANQGSNNVSVFEPDGTFYQTIPVGMTPVAVAASAGNHKIYVANQGDNTVTVIQDLGYPYEPNITINVGVAPDALDVDEATGKVYVANRGDNTVTVIDGSTDTVLTTLPLGNNADPAAVAADSESSVIYVSNFMANNVTQISEPLNSEVEIETHISPLPQNATANENPTFTVTATSLLGTKIDSLYYQFDSTQQDWTVATGTGTFTVAGDLDPGFHVLYAYATDGQETGSAAGAFGNTEVTAGVSSPITGSITAYGFTVGAAEAKLQTPQTAITGPNNAALPASAAAGTQISAVATTNASTFAMLYPNDGCTLSDIADGAGNNGGTAVTFTITMTSGASSCVVTAEWAADTNYQPATANATITLTGNQTGSFVGLPSSEAYNAQFQVTATTNGDQEATITATGPCTVGVESMSTIAGGGTDTTATVTMTGGAGTCALTANWTADTNFTGAVATGSVPAALAVPTVSLTSPVTSALYNSTFQVTAMTNASTAATIGGTDGVCNVGSVSSTTTVSGVTTNATVTVVAGTQICTVTASWAADSNYEAYAAPNLLVATLPVRPSVAFTGAPTTAAYGSTPFTVTATNGDGTIPNITGTTGVCTVSSLSSSAANTYTATVTMSTGTGTCTLTAAWPATADGDYSNVGLSQTTTAAKATPTVTFTGAPATAAYQSAFSVMATTNASTLPTIAGTAGVCSVGAVTGTASSASATITMTSGTGTCALTANWAADSNYSTASAGPSNVTASKIAATVTFTGAPASAADGSTFPVTATTNASTVPTIAGSGACSAGAVSGTAASATATISMTAATGTCSLSASWAADNNYNSATATQSTAATAASLPMPTITWSAPAAITYGTALSGTQLDATATYAGATVAGTFTYTPAKGTVLTAGTQTLSVLFTPANTAKYSAATASVMLTVNQATPKIAWSNPAAITYGTPLSGTQLDATASFGGTSLPGAFVYTPPAGTILDGGTQTLSVQFTAMDTVDFTVATGSVTINVKDATPTITWPAPAAISYGTPLSATQLNATASSGGVTLAGTFVYSPAAGTVEAGGSHTLSVTFTPMDAADFTTATAKVTLQVNPSAPDIVWTTPAAVPVGTALTSTQLDAKAAFGGSNVAGTFTYTPAKGTVMTAAGNQTLSVSFAPTNTANYTATTGSVVLSVTPATPVLKWTKPAAIVYGTALSATQLDATASASGVVLPGAFNYSPGVGTVLTAGTQTLGVTFTPMDSMDYTTAMDSVTITVNLATSATTIASASPNPSVRGQAVTVNFSVANASVPGVGTPTGTVTVTASTGETCSATLTAGTGSCQITFTTKGSRNLGASYSGDTNFKTSNSPKVAQTVNP